MKSTATYLYCLVRSPRAPSLAGTPRGLPGAAPPRALDAGGGVWAVVATVPLARYGAAPVERNLRDLKWVSACAVAHEAVVASFLAATAVVPAKLFILFDDDARALAHVTRERRRIERALERVAGCAEWGVRVHLDERRALLRASARDGNGARAAVSGTGFLQRKQRVHRAARELGARARAHVDEMFEELAARASDARRRPPEPSGPSARLVLDAAYLVPRGGAAGFKQAVRAATRALAPSGYDVTLTGPWPPYNFVAGGP
jgi:hypothetical protein